MHPTPASIYFHPHFIYTKLPTLTQPNPDGPQRTQEPFEMAFLMADAPPVGPRGPPDFHICSSLYGSQISLASCLPLLNALPSAALAYPYRTRPPLPLFNAPPVVNIQVDPYTLPYTAVSGGCRLSIEIGGRERAPVVLLVPDEIRALTEYLLWKCVWTGSGVGGFATLQFGALRSWVVGQIGPGTVSRDRTPFSQLLRKYFC